MDWQDVLVDNVISRKMVFDDWIKIAKADKEVMTVQEYKAKYSPPRTNRLLRRKRLPK